MENKLKVKELVRKSVLAVNPYIPGKPIEETKRQLGLKKVIKLASNENSWGPSPKAINAIRRSLSGGQPLSGCAGVLFKETFSQVFWVDSREFCFRQWFR